MAPFTFSSIQHFPPHAALPCHTSSCFQQSLLPPRCQNSCVATAAKSAHWSKLHFQNSSAHGDTTKGMLVKITAFAGLLPPAAEFLESKFSSLSSPLFQQLGLGFSHMLPTARGVIRNYSSKAVLAAVFKLRHSLGRSFSLTIGIDLSTPQPWAALVYLGEALCQKAFQLFCMALNRAALLSSTLKRSLCCIF